MGRKVVCNNGFRQQRETELTVSTVYKDVAWKQKAKTGVPIVSKLMRYIHHTGSLGVARTPRFENDEPKPEDFFIHGTRLAQCDLRLSSPNSLGVHAFLRACSPFKEIKFLRDKPL